VDFKAPGSAEAERNDWANVDRLRAGDEVKIVVADRADFDWAARVVREHDLASRVPVHLSPVYGELDPARLADWVIGSGLNVRLNLQLHKTLWGDVPGR
jgi:7-carboxy-7-deazaguanine synthase